MLTSFATCSGWGRRARRDAADPEAQEPAAAAPHPDRVRPHPAAWRACLRRPGDLHRPPLSCWFASARAAVGSRSPRPSARSEALRRPGVEIALVPITTAGDRDRTRPFGEIGSRGVFVKELEEALLEGRIDVAVHSAKDMTSTDTAGLVVGAYPPREDPRDALCGAAAIEPGHADRHRVRQTPGPASRARAEPLRRAAAWERRHAPPQAGRAWPRRRRARRLRARSPRPRR